MKEKIIKIIISIVVIIIAVILVACGSKQEETEEVSAAAEETAKAEVDTGVFKTVSPAGWVQGAAPDLTTGQVSPNALELIKGESADPENAPYLLLRYHEDSAISFDGSLYTGAADIEPFVTGKYTWRGITASSSGQPFTYMTAVAATGSFEAWLWMHTGCDVSASVADEDVQEILAGLTLS